MWMVWIWNAFEWRKNDFETEMRDRKNIKHWYMVIQFTGHKTFRYYAYEVVFRFGFYIEGWSIKVIETERETYQCGVLSYLIQVYILWIWINQSTSQSIINQLNQPTQQPLRQIQSNCFFFFFVIEIIEMYLHGLQKSLNITHDCSLIHYHICKC